jgi:hypothetical protein
MHRKGVNHLAGITYITQDNTMSTQLNEYEALWQNPVNWRLYIFYACREDPRLIVHKRFRVTGWTMNFAHPQAYFLFAALLAVVILPITVVEIAGVGEVGWVRPVTLVISMLAAFALTWWASRLRVK